MNCFFFFILKLYILMNPSNSMKVYGLIALFKYPILFFFLGGKYFWNTKYLLQENKHARPKKENERNMRCCLFLKHWRGVCVLAAGFLFHEFLDTWPTSSYKENITRGRARSSMRRRKISKKKVSKLSYLFSFPDWL